MTPATTPDDGATRRALDALREMIMRRELVPGEQVRQEELARRLGLSRSPLREALRSLQSEGLVRHAPNQGYFVVQLRAEELEQAYLMRRLLEGEVLRSLVRPNARGFNRLRALNDDVRAAMASDSVPRMLVANARFHFALFALSPLELVVREVERLWRLSQPYQATYLWLPDTRDRVVEEHDQMVDALADDDLERLVRIADAHRAASQGVVLALLRAQVATV